MYIIIIKCRAAVNVFPVTIIMVLYFISRAAVMTGRYQMRSGFYPKGLDPGDIGGV